MVGYSLGGGSGRSSSARLGIGREFVRGLEVPADSRAKGPSGTETGVLKPWWGECGLRGTRNGTSLSKGPRSSLREAMYTSPSKNNSHISASQWHQGRQDRYVIALVGGKGLWPPRDSELGKVLRGASRHPGKIVY